MGAREVQVTLRRCDNDSLGAGHASSEVLGHSATAVAEPELIATNAYDSTIVGARCALTVDGRGVVVVRYLGRLILWSL